MVRPTSRKERPPTHSILHASGAGSSVNNEPTMTLLENGNCANRQTSFVSGKTDEKDVCAKEKIPSLSEMDGIVRTGVQAEIAKQVVRKKLSKFRHAVVKEAVKKEYLDSLFPSLLEHFNPQTVTVCCVPATILFLGRYNFCKSRRG